MKTSIIIPNYNGQKYLKDCLDSLSKQSFKEFEIIIVDNDSKDGSCEFISENYPRVKLISLTENYGFSTAVNEGIKASMTGYVVLLNNDTVVFEDWLEGLVKCIEKDKKIFSCCSKMIQYNSKDKIDDAGDEYTLLGWAYKRGDGEAVSNYNRNCEVFSSCAGAAIYRKSVFEQIGYFDEKFFAYMEDVDISYRAKIFGYKNVYCSDAKVYHIGSATSGSRHNAFKVKLASRNNIYVAFKNMPLLQLILNIPFIFLGCIIKYMYFIKKGLSKEYLNGISEGIRNIRKGKVHKVQFYKRNVRNYIFIEMFLILNIFKIFFAKFRKN